MAVLLCNVREFHGKLYLILVGRNVSRPDDMDFTTWTRMFVRGSLQTPTGECHWTSHIAYLSSFFMHWCLLMLPVISALASSSTRMVFA